MCTLINSNTHNDHRSLNANRHYIKQKRLTDRNTHTRARALLSLSLSLSHTHTHTHMCVRAHTHTRTHIHTHEHAHTKTRRDLTRKKHTHTHTYTRGTGWGVWGGGGGGGRTARPSTVTQADDTQSAKLGARSISASLYHRFTSLSSRGSTSCLITHDDVRIHVT